MKKAYVVPHPPIILPEVGRGEEKKIAKTIEAFEQIANEIAEIEPETIIISSPHAPYYSDAFYLADATEAKGDLSAFGVWGVEERVPIDRELCEEILVTGKDLPIYYSEMDGDNLDHGSLIPIRFIKAVYSDFKVVRLGISTLSGEDHYRVGMAIAKAAEKLGRRCVYIASGDLSHVLKRTLTAIEKRDRHSMQRLSIFCKGRHLMSCWRFPPWKRIRQPNADLALFR